MSQGYGQQGSGGQDQQWSQAPGGDPGVGSMTSPTASTAAKIVKWLMILTIAVVAYRALMGIISFSTGFLLSASGAVASDPEAALIGSRLLDLILLAINGLVSLALLVASVITAIRTRAKGRIGAILIVAALVISVVLFWVNQVIFRVTVISATDLDAAMTWSFVHIGLEIGRWLLIAAMMIAGAVMARRWVKQNAGAAQTA